MDEARDPARANRAKAFLVDPVSMTVVWANWPGLEPGADISMALPVAETLGLAEVVREVASTGVSCSRRADLVPTRRGSMVLAVSLHRLPAGTVLVLVENVWEHAGPGPGGTRQGRSRHRTS